MYTEACHSVMINIPIFVGKRLALQDQHWQQNQRVFFVIMSRIVEALK
jgi:hypothetical protein